MNGKQEDRISYAFAPSADKDAARRMSESVHLHLTAVKLSDAFANVVGKWLAFALRDGTQKDSAAIFDSKAEAVRFHEPFEKDYCYLRITPDGIRPEDAWRFLRINRLPMIDVTAPEHVHAPQIFPHMSNLTREQRRKVARVAERNARNGN